MRSGGLDLVNGRSLAVDKQGNVYTSGSFSGTADFDPGPGTVNLTSAGESDVFVSKLDKNGTLVWARSMDGNGVDAGSDMALDGWGNIYTTGRFSGTVDFDPGPGTFYLTSTSAADTFVSKLDTNGTFVWARSMGGTNFADSVATDGQGNVYTTGDFVGTVDFDPGPGTVNLTSAGEQDVFVSKLNTNGTFVWARRMGGTNFDRGEGAAVDRQGNVYTTGACSGTVDFDPGPGTVELTGGHNLFVSKLDKNGTFVWARRMGGVDSSHGHRLAVDGQGNVYTTGFFVGTVDFDPGPGTDNLTSAGESDMFVSKLAQRTIGDRVWQDLDADGVQDPGEPGKAGVVVELWNGDVNLLDVQTTDVNGVYLFVGPSEAASVYGLVFQPPFDFTFTLRDAGGDDTLDSDVDPLTSSTPLFELFGEHDLTLDAGLVPRPISGRVWHDLDGDGVQDADDPGIAGGEVELWTGSGNLVDVQTTDANGVYRFPGPFDSTIYHLNFQLPQGCSTFTVRDAGGDDTRDSDVDSGGSTAPFIGKYIPTLDAGLLCDPISLVFPRGTRSTDGTMGPAVAGQVRQPLDIAGSDPALGRYTRKA